MIILILTIDCDSCIASNPTPTPTPTQTPTPTPGGCNEWDLEGGPGSVGNFSYTDCSSASQTESVDDGDSASVCALGVPTLTSGIGTVTLVGVCVTPTPTATPTPTPTPGAPTPTPGAPTPTPTPGVSYDNYTITRCDGGFNNYTVGRALANTFPTYTVLLMPDGNCYEIVDPTGTLGTLANAEYTDCNSCTAPTPTPTPGAPTRTPTPTPTPTPSPTPGAPTPTPTPSPTPGAPTPTPTATPTPTPTPTATPRPTATPTPCIAIEVGYSTGLYYGCCVPPDNNGIKYFNANSVATATRLYTGLGCTTLESGTIYVSEFGSTYYEFFNGVKTAGPTSCPSCP